MATHKVKSWPPFFKEMATGAKKHDMRNMRDRNYRVGDRLILQEYDPFRGEYTGVEMAFDITYITSKDTPCALSSAMLDDDACILSLEPVDVCSKE